MSRGILTLEAGSRFWFEGEVWEVDTFLGNQVRLRRGVTVRTVSTSALLAAATPLGDTTKARDQEGDPFTLSAVALAGLMAKQRREVKRKVEELRPLLQPAADGRSHPERLASRATELGVSVRTLERRLERFEARGPAALTGSALRASASLEARGRWAFRPATPAQPA